MDLVYLAIGIGLMAALISGVALTIAISTKRRPRLPEAKCGCGHDRCFHDPKSGECSESDRVDKRNGVGNWIGYAWKPCGCRQYTGPQPLTDFFPPQIILPRTPEADR